MLETKRVQFFDSQCIVVCSAWSTCNTNLQREGCTIYDLIMQMVYSPNDNYEYYDYDDDLFEQVHKENVQAVQHLCNNTEPGTNTRHSVSTA